VDHQARYDAARIKTEYEGIVQISKGPIEKTVNQMQGTVNSLEDSVKRAQSYVEKLPIYLDALNKWRSFEHETKRKLDYTEKVFNTHVRVMEQKEVLNKNMHSREQAQKLARTRVMIEENMLQREIKKAERSVRDLREISISNSLAMKELRKKSRSCDLPRKAYWLCPETKKKLYYDTDKIAFKQFNTDCPPPSYSFLEGLKLVACGFKFFGEMYTVDSVKGIIEDGRPDSHRLNYARDKRHSKCVRTWATGGKRTGTGSGATAFVIFKKQGYKNWDPIKKDQACVRRVRAQYERMKKQQQEAYNKCTSANLKTQQELKIASVRKAQQEAQKLLKRECEQAKYPAFNVVE